VFALADRITVLVEGRPIASGATEAIRGNREMQRAYLATRKSPHRPGDGW